ncbi:MAG TPA: homoserine O-acetyltransferase, partial [Propylenella sp.]
MEDLARSQAERPASPVARFGPDQPLPLDAGVSLSPIQIAYQTY